MQQKIREFLDHLLVERGLAENTISAYHNDLTQFLQFIEGQGITRWTDTTQETIADFLKLLKERGLSSSSAARKLAALKTYYHYLLQNHVIAENPTVAMERPKTGRYLPKVLSQAEVEQLLNQPGLAPRERAIMELLYSGGLRVSELTKVNISDVNLHEGHLRMVGKEGKERIIPLSETAIRAIEVYLKQSAIANPHATFVFQAPNGEEIRFERSIDKLPPRPSEIKPHPYGIELGRLIQMLSETTSRTLLQFLVDEFSSVGKKTACEIIARAGKHLAARSYPRHIARAQANALHHAIQCTHISAPRTNCIVPIGEQQLLEGLRKELQADFHAVATRPAAVYRGNPFQVEVAIAYGRPEDAGCELDDSGHMHGKNTVSEHLIARKNQPVRLLRFANRVPLLYQQSSCAITKAVTQTNWRAYGLQQTKGSIPIAPMCILVHVASVWVPYTSESKEAVAPYQDILKEIRLGLQQCGRQLAH